MTNIEKAVKLAREGGYFGYPNYEFPNEGGVAEEQIFLDKNFWVALGKSLGWSDVYRDHDENSVEECWCKPKVILNGGAFITVHNDLTTKGRFTEFMTDYIYDGKTPESYFKELLKGE